MFKIEISIMQEPDERGYQQAKEIYSQKIEELDVAAVIAVVNKLVPKQPVEHL